jgi:hypothetical protein
VLFPLPLWERVPAQRAGEGRIAARLPPAPLPRFANCNQNVTLQLLMYPVSWLALSFTRSFQVPFNGSLDRFTV